MRVLRSTTGPATGPTPNAEQVRVHEGTGESLEDTNLANGTTYYYTAYARDDAGLWSARATRRATPADATERSVVGVSPANRAKGVSSRANVVATFSEAMDEATVTGTTVKLVRGGTTRAAAATVSYDAETNEATLDPSAKLAGGMKYMATVTSGAKDLAGNALDQTPSVAGEQPKRAGPSSPPASGEGKRRQGRGSGHSNPSPLTLIRIRVRGRGVPEVGMLQPQQAR